MEEIETLERLLEIMHAHDLDALKVTVGDRTYELVRREPGAAAVPVVSGAPAAPGLPGVPAVAPGSAKRVTAPLVGVFYRSSSPDAEPFVTVGDRVEIGDVLCVLEAMKLFNEITSDYAGVVTRIIPENGELVSLGQEMFWIEP